MTVDNGKRLESAYHQGLRCIHGETKYTQLQYGARTNLGVRQDLRALSIRQTVSSRRLGLLKRLLDSNPEWMLGLIIEQWNAPRGWTKEVNNYFLVLVKLETGMPPAPMQVIIQAKSATNKKMESKNKDRRSFSIINARQRGRYRKPTEIPTSSFIVNRPQSGGTPNQDRLELPTV